MRDRGERPHERDNSVRGIKARRSTATQTAQQLRLSGRLPTEPGGPHVVIDEECLNRRDELFSRDNFHTWTLSANADIATKLSAQAEIDCLMYVS